jgi:hypothetical protein
MIIDKCGLNILRLNVDRDVVIQITMVYNYDFGCQKLNLDAMYLLEPPTPVSVSGIQKIRFRGLSFGD